VAEVTSPNTDDVRRALEQADDDGPFDSPFDYRCSFFCQRPPRRRRSRVALVLTFLAIAAVVACVIWGPA
jgi:hypothetical protein